MNGAGAPGNLYRLPEPQRPGARIEPFSPFYASQMQGRATPPRSWLVDGIAMRKTCVLFAGPPKIGKSLALQLMLTAAAIGSPWLGHTTVATRAFGLFCEDAQDEIERRQIAINAHYEISAADLELDLSWDAREAREATLVEFDRSDKPIFTPLWHQLWQHVAERGIQIVGIDTAATTFGGNENFRGQVTAYMRACVAKSVEMDGTIILNVHPSKSTPGSYSGTTAWLASSRFGMSLGRPNDYDPETDIPRDARVLRGLGSNYTPGFHNQRLEFRDGILVPADTPEAAHKRGPLNHTERQDLEYRLLAGLKRVRDNGSMVPADELASTSLPNRARRAADPLLNRIALNDLYQAQEDLIASGRVIRVAVQRKCMLRPADGTPYDGEGPW